MKLANCEGLVRGSVEKGINNGVKWGKVQIDSILEGQVWRIVKSNKWIRIEISRLTFVVSYNQDKDGRSLQILSEYNSTVIDIYFFIF